MSKLNRILAGAIVITAGFGTTYVWSQTTRSTTATAPATTASTQDSLPIAEINGQQINNKAFYDLLMEIAGPRVFEEILNLTVVRVAAGDAGVGAARGDTTALGEIMQAEYKLMVNSVPLTKDQEDDIRKDPKIGTATTKPDDAVFNVRQRILDNAWTQQGRTLKEIQMVLEQQALLRAMSMVGGLTPKPDEISRAFDNKYGEKVTMVLINLGDDKRKADTAAAAIRKVLNATSPTAKVTRTDLEKGLNDKSIAEYKVQAKGGIIPKSADELKTIRDEAFSAKIADGGLSAVVTFTPPGATSKENYYLIWIEKHEAANSSVKLTDPQIQKELMDAVLFDKQNTWMNQRLAELRQRAKVTVNDPTLFKIFKDWSDRMQASTSQAAPSGADIASTGPSPATTPAGPSMPAPVGPRSATSVPALTPLTPGK